MNNQDQHKTFIFNEKINKELLFSLYEDDFSYMEEIFSITLTQLKPDISTLRETFENNDLAGLQKAVHKIKPSFGYIGLPEIQELCKEFEEICATSSSVSQIATPYTFLCTRLGESIHIIETEYEKLKNYNLS